jgi:hypothetical protein
MIELNKLREKSIMEILNAGDPNFMHTDPRYKHVEKITKLDNGDEMGECECGRKILYPDMSGKAYDRTLHKFIKASVKPNFKFSEDFLKGLSM